MLKNYFYPIMQRKKLNNKMIFLQDGTSSHFSKEVRTWFNGQFNGRWIGRAGPIFWAVGSPNLVPLDFLLWGYMKTKVSKTKINDIADLKD